MPEIVKPEIMYGDAGLGSYLKGLSVIAAVNAKKRATEMQIAKLQENEQVAEWRHEKDIESLQQNEKKIEDLDRFHSIEAESQKLRENRLQQTFSDKSKQQQEDTQRLIDMQSKVYAIPAKRGTTDYQKQLDDIKDQYSDITGTAEAKRIISPIEQQHKTARTESFKAFNNQISSLGIPPQYAPALFATPEMWQIGDEEKTGKMQFQLGPNTLVKIPKATYDKLKPRYQEFYTPGSATVPTDKQDLPSIPVISTKDDYEGLPPGSPFIWNGKRGTKPGQ